MTPHHFAELLTHIKEIRRLQKLRDRYKWDSLSPGERAKKAKCEKWVDEFLREHEQAAGTQAKVFG